MNSWVASRHLIKVKANLFSNLQRQAYMAAKSDASSKIIMWLSTRSRLMAIDRPAGVICRAANPSIRRTGADCNMFSLL